MWTCNLSNKASIEQSLRDYLLISLDQTFSPKARLQLFCVFVPWLLNESLGGANKPSHPRRILSLFSANSCTKINALAGVFLLFFNLWFITPISENLNWHLKLIGIMGALLDVIALNLRPIEHKIRPKKIKQLWSIMFGFYASFIVLLWLSGYYL